MYGMDVAMEGLVYAVSLRSPRFGGVLAGLDATEARAMPGVIDAIQLPDRATVIAESTWQAIQARDALSAEWDFSQAENRGTEELRAEYTALLDEEGIAFHSAVVSQADTEQVIEADYSFPYLAHTPMEPIDVTVRFDGTEATFWTGSQIQTLDQNIGAQVLGIDPGSVSIETLWGGGSFGRRAIYDSHYVAEAAMIAKAWLEAHGDARPIKLVWTREDDVRAPVLTPTAISRRGNNAWWGKVSPSEPRSNSSWFGMVSMPLRSRASGSIRPTPFRDGRSISTIRKLACRFFGGARSGTPTPRMWSKR